MSRVIVLPAHLNLVAKIVTSLTPDGADYSSSTVVFPGKRPAHFLRRALGERTGAGFIPPTIHSMDTFVDALSRSLLGEHEPELQPIDAVSILHDIHLRSGERMGGKSFDALDAFLPLGLKMFGELEELKIAGIAPGKIESLGTPLGRVYRRFYEEVTLKGYRTRSMEYMRLAESMPSMDLDALKKIIVAGFFALTSAEKAIFKVLLGLPDSLFLFQQGKGLEARLQELGVNPELRLASGTRPLIQLYRSTDAHGQVFGLSTNLKRLLESKQAVDEQTVIVIPAAESLFPLVHQTLSFLPDEGYNISCQYPVKRTPVYGFLMALMDVVTSIVDGQVYAPDYIKLMLHPYVKNILLGQRSDATRILVHTIEGELAGDKSRTFFSLEELEEQKMPFERAARSISGGEGEVSAAELKEHLRFIHDQTIRKLAGRGSVGDLARRCIEVLLFVDEHTTAKHHPLFRPYVESLIESLEGIATSLLRERSLADSAQSFGVIRHTLESTQVAFPGTPLQGLQVLGFLETRNLQFKRVFVLDANEGVFPATGNQHTLIPQNTREVLGLPTSRMQEQIAAYYFDVLLGGATEAHFFFRENSKDAKSRFVEQLVWQAQKDRRSERTPDLLHQIQYRVDLSSNPPVAIAKTEEVVEFLKQFTYNATALDTYLRCPLQFYYSFVLRLEEREGVAGEIDRADVGSFVHAVLSSFYKVTLGGPLTPEGLKTDRLDKLVDDSFGEFFGWQSPGARYLMKMQIKTQLRRFIESYQAPLLRAHKIEVLGLESKIEVLKNSYSLKGFLDRVERRGDRIYILDYKTGSRGNELKVRFDKFVPGDRGTWKQAIGSLQLPLYALIYAESNAVDIERLVPAYLLLGTNKMNEEIELPLLNDGDSPGEKYRLLEGLLFMLLAEITDPDHPFLPTEDLEEDCPRCLFKYICGTQWVRGYDTY